MPIAYWNCVELDLALCRWTGLVTPDEFRANFRDYLSDTNFRSGRTEIIDLTDLTDFVGNFRAIRTAVDFVNSNNEGRLVETRTVVIAPHSGVFGLGRMWQQLSELSGGLAIELYESAAEALAALGLPHATVDDLFGSAIFLEADPTGVAKPPTE